MENLPLILFVTVVLASFLASTRLGKIKPEEARQLVEQGAKLLDVRTNDEFQAGHLPGAVNVPLAELYKRMVDLGRKQEPIVIYCASGMRSRLAKNLLSKRGYSRVFDLGAMSRWRA